MRMSDWNLTDLYPYIGLLAMRMGDLTKSAAEFMMALEHLDLEAYRDIRSRLSVERFDAALKDIDAFLRPLWGLIAT
jgi:hypothetical protein